MAIDPVPHVISERAASVGAFLSHGEKEVNEEQLFHAVVRMRLQSQGGGEALKKYDARYEEMKRTNKRPDGRPQVEQWATSALDALVKAGTLKRSARDRIYTEAFTAAQLDSDPSKLYDSFGGKGDPTRAVAEVTRAIAKADQALKRISTGSSTPSAPSDTSLRMKSDRDMRGFLFKPVSNNEGTLAIILPSGLSGRVERVEIRDGTGTVLERGRFTSLGEKGTNMKFAFSKQGAGYPEGITVVAVGRDGSEHSWQISDTSKRLEA